VAGKATAAEARFIFRPVDEEILHINHKNQVVVIRITFISIQKPWNLSTHFISVLHATVRKKTLITISDSINVVVLVKESNVLFKI
jgi:hypothetical protein